MNKTTTLKSASVVIGRFQPPTKGHGRLIDAAKELWRKHKLDNVIVVVIEGKNTSENKEENPLSSDDRIKFLKASTFGTGIKFLVASDAITAFEQVRKAGYEISAFTSGDDRFDSYKQILEKYFAGEDGKKVKRYYVNLKRNQDSSTLKGVSGTIARLAAKLGHFDEFKNSVAVSEKIAKTMYDKIRSSMGVK